MSVELHTKYVMVELAHVPGMPVPILLPQCVEHNVTKAIGKPISAGFVRTDPTAEHGVVTFGFSTGLNLKPRPEDARLIARWHAEAFARPRVLVHG